MLNTMKGEILLTLLVFALQGLAFKQEAYKFVHEYVVLNNSNSKYVENIHIQSYKFNRTVTAINASFDLLIPADSGWEVAVTGYQFRSNEYRKGPIHFNLNLCSLIASKDFDVPAVLSHSNIKSCPLKKGHHYLNEASPDAHTYPPLVPSGKWMLELAFFSGNKELVGTIHWYLKVVYNN